MSFKCQFHHLTIEPALPCKEDTDLIINYAKYGSNNRTSLPPGREQCYFGVLAVSSITMQATSGFSIT